MLRKQLTSLLFLCWAWNISAQINLVPNPSFEEFVNCPNKFSQVSPAIGTLFLPPIDEYLKDWVIPTIGSSDFYHGCNTTNPLVSVPDNVAGHIPARKGMGYAGVYLFVTDNFVNEWTYREYMQVKLKAPLEKDVEYCLSFYTRPMRHNITDSSGYIYAIKEIGMNLSDVQVADFANTRIYANLPLVPQLTPGYVISENDWVNVSMIYTAQGGEEWLTIGNFKDDSGTTERKLIEGAKVLPTQWDYPFHYAYYFIDDVSVFALKGVRAFFYDTYKVCEQELPYPFSARDNLDYYHWDTGETTQTAHFEEAGWHRIEASFAGCPIRDSVLVQPVSPPVVDLGPDIDLCENGQLKTVTLSNADSLPSYHWSNSSPASTLTTNEPGVYRLFTEHICGHFEDEITLSGCDVNVYIPNVITPDSRDVNSVFLPFGSNITVELLEIYDQFGRMVYHEYPVVSGWDGYVKGRPVQPGVFIYRIRYRRLTDGGSVEKVGDVTVIR